MEEDAGAGGRLVELADRGICMDYGAAQSLLQEFAASPQIYWAWEHLLLTADCIWAANMELECFITAGMLFSRSIGFGSQGAFLCKECSTALLVEDAIGV